MPIVHAQLRAFHAVAAEGGFTKAARRLGVSQPTLSEQVSQLEAAYGVKLFERRGRGSEVTDLGRALFDLTARLFALEADAEQLLSAARGLQRGRLKVAADAPYLVTPLIAAFNRRHPGIELTVAFGNSQWVIENLKSRQADIGVLPVVPDERLIKVQAIKKDRLVLLAPRHHPWARRRTIKLEELVSERLILREKGSITRAIFEEALTRAQFHPSAVWEIGSREGVREAVAEGLGIGVVSESELGRDDRLVAISVRDQPLATTEYAACLAARREEKIIAAFFALLPSSL